MINHLVRIAVLLYLFASIGSANAQAVPVHDEGGYRIGPYPIPIETEGVKTDLWTWLYFLPVIEGRGPDRSYKLKLAIKANLSTLPTLVKSIADKKFDKNNCARYGVDNWVYVFEQPTIEMAGSNRLVFTSTGIIATWTCIQNLVPETVCEQGQYRDSLGLS
jgi:hypothetical protein